MRRNLTYAVMGANIISLAIRPTGLDGSRTALRDFTIRYKVENREEVILLKRTYWL